MPWLAAPDHRLSVLERLESSVREVDPDSRISVRRIHSDCRSVGELNNEIEQLLRFLLRAKLGDDCLGQLANSCINCFFRKLESEPFDARYDRLLEDSSRCCTQGGFNVLMRM